MVFSVGDTELYYKVMGQGPPVLMLHGWGGCADSFAPVSLKLASKEPHLFSKIIFTGGAGIRPKRTFAYYRRTYSYKLAKRLAKHKWGVGLYRLFGVDVKKRVENAGSPEYKALPEHMRRTFSNIVNEDLTP